MRGLYVDSGLPVESHRDDLRVMTMASGTRGLSIMPRGSMYHFRLPKAVAIRK